MGSQELESGDQPISTLFAFAALRCSYPLRFTARTRLVLGRTRRLFLG